MIGIFGPGNAATTRAHQAAAPAAEAAPSQRHEASDTSTRPTQRQADAGAQLLGGVMPARATGVADGARGGAATIGEAPSGSLQFLNLFGSRPEVVASNLPSVDKAVERGARHGGPVAIRQASDGSYEVLDLGRKDLDNGRLPKEKTGWFRREPYPALVTQDGDVLRANGNDYTNEGRLHPAPVNVRSLSAGDAERLSGERIGTTRGHAKATIGAQVGDPKGYANRSDAAAAAAGLGGTHAIVQLGSRHHVFEAKLPSNTDVDDLRARGTGVSPVSALTVQSGNKTFSAAAPGEPFAYAGRATPFDPQEPVGHSIAGRSVQRHAGEIEPGTQPVHAIPTDIRTLDEVLTGTRGGYAVIDAGGEQHLYELGSSQSSKQWDDDLGSVEAHLRRETDTRFRYERTGYGEYTTIWRVQEERDEVVLTDVDTRQRRELEHGQWHTTNRTVDWWETERAREPYRDRGTSPGDDYGSGGTSPGDGYGSGGTSPGDGYGSGGTSPGDDYGRGGTSPGDDRRSGSGSSSGTSPSDDYRSGGSSSGTSPSDDYRSGGGWGFGGLE